MTRLLVVLCCLPGCLLGSGNAATETRDIGAFDAVHNRTFARVQVVAGESIDEVVVTCDANLLGMLITEVVDDVLVVRTERLTMPILPMTPCEVAVDVDDLVQLENSGSGRVTVQGGPVSLTTITNSGSGAVIVDEIVTSTLDTRNSGSGGLTVEDLTAELVSVHNSGSGRSQLRGTVDVADLALTGSGGAREADLVADEAVVSLSGSGGAELTVLSHLDAHLSGSGGVLIHGAPEHRDVRTTGSGRVRFADD